MVIAFLLGQRRESFKGSNNFLDYHVLHAYYSVGKVTTKK